VLESRLLRVRYERPSRRSSEQRDELASLQVAHEASPPGKTRSDTTVPAYRILSLPPSGGRVLGADFARNGCLGPITARVVELVTVLLAMVGWYLQTRGVWGRGDEAVRRGAERLGSIPTAKWFIAEPQS